MLKSITTDTISFAAVSAAYHQASAFKQNAGAMLKERFEKASRKMEDIYVVLLGRPYTVLDPSMNKRIPDIFASFGMHLFSRHAVL